MHASNIEADRQGAFNGRQQRMIAGGGGCNVKKEKAAYLGFELDPVIQEKKQQLRKLGITRMVL